MRVRSMSTIRLMRSLICNLNIVDEQKRWTHERILLLIQFHELIKNKSIFLCD